MRTFPQVLLMLIVTSGMFSPAHSAEKPAAEKPEADKPAAPAKQEKAADALVKLNPEGTVLLDLKGKRVLLKTKVVQREAVLEFFCCLSQTLEHESIVALDSKAMFIHAALLRIGAKPGKPAQFEPEYKPPTGQKIDIFVQWRDKKKTLHRVRAQDWVQRVTRRFYSVPMEKLPNDLKIPAESELRYDKFAKELLWFGPMTEEQKKRLLAWSKDAAYKKGIEKFFDDSQPRKMTAEWVFAGSQFVRDEPGGPEYYLAESGQIISVANFSSSIIDISMKSTDAEANLLFEAATDQIPPLGTEVTVELIPQFKPVKGEASKKSAAASETTPSKSSSK